LQLSAGGTQVPQVHEAEQVLVPLDPQDVVHVDVAPAQQAEPLSQTVSQSSSLPLQDSAGGVQEEGGGSVQVELHVPLPVEAQVVVQETGWFCMQAKPSSIRVSPSSSAPLQSSLESVHVPHAHDDEHTRIPGCPSTVQASEVPAQQVEPSSQLPSQSLSTPSQVSAGGVQAPHAHDDEQTLVPVVPHEAVQEPVAPRQQGKPSSQAPSQSSSVPLQDSGGGRQAAPDGTWQVAVQSPLPAVPHEVVHGTVFPCAHG
jgi:hypothetical protein